MDLLTLVAKLTLDSEEYEKGLDSMRKKAEGSADKMKSGMLKATGVGAAALAAFAGASVKTGAEFDSSMSQVAATLGKTMDELANEVGTVDTAYGEFSGNLREYAQFMGANTAFSAKQAADALNYMALAGYDTQKSMDMLPTVLSLAAAGGMDLAKASDMVTDASSALNLSQEDTVAMVDKMAKTASKTNTSVEQLGEAMLTVGGTASYMRGGTTELSQVLGILADNSMKGSEGGTHLRNILLKLSSPTKEGAEWIKKLGLNIFDAEGNMRSFSDIFPELNSAMSSLTDEQRLDALSQMFNARDIAAVNALLNASTDRWNELETAIDGAWYTTASLDEQFSKLGKGLNFDKFRKSFEKLGVSAEDVDYALAGANGNADLFIESILNAADAGVDMDDVLSAMPTSLEELQKAFDNTSGSAQAMADTQLDNLEGDITLLKSAFEGLQIKISDDLTPVTRDFVQMLTGVIDSFDTWAPIVTGLAVAFGVLAVAVNFGTIVTGVATAFSTLFTVLSANPIGVVIAVIAGLVTALVTAWNTNEGFRNAVLTAWDAIKAGAQKLWEKILSVKDWIVGAWDTLKEKAGLLADKFDEIKNKIGDAMESAKEKVRTAIEKIKSFFNFSWSLPKLKMPHISITGGFNLIPPSAPKFSIDWYKKAYNGIIKFPQNTILPTTQGFKGFSDGVGSELLMSEAKYINSLKAVSSGNVNSEAIVNEIRGLREDITRLQIVLDTGAIAGAVSPNVDANLGSFAVFNSRGI